jgi:hypothetical protein
VVEAVARRFPNVPQFACFDTAFHRSMPAVAQRYPLPFWTAEAGVRRYGFHGLSSESIVSQLKQIDARGATGRVLIAHLGNGASVTAVRDGLSVDTSMGFSPTGGLMMGTRCGDLDPTVVTFLTRTHAMTPDAVEKLMNEESGLLGVSGQSQDMRDLLERAASESQASEAIELYCYTARKHIGALAAVLDGVDTIVFTGGVGEHAALIREKICSGLEYLGVQFDRNRNAANEAVIRKRQSCHCACDSHGRRFHDCSTCPRAAQIKECLMFRFDTSISSAVETPAERSQEGPVLPATGPLSPELLDRMQRYWQAANYLTIGQIYLQENPLLREPLRPEHIKPRLLGHWGTSPGLSLIYVHLNRLITEYDANIIFLAGPGRCRRSRCIQNCERKGSSHSSEGGVIQW